MVVKISQRLLAMPASPIRKLVPYALMAKKQGVKVYHLNIGDPDIKTPEVIIQSLKNWRINPIGYGQSQGQPELIEAVKWYYHRLGFNFIEEKNIQITSGGSEGISLAFFAVTNPGDEIITFEPLYTNYNSYAVFNGIKIVPVLTVAENGFHLPPKAKIEKKITKKTKAILICNPNNPTGTVYTKQEIEMLLGLAKKHRLFVISDEVYREFTYDGRRQISLFNYMKTMADQIIVIDSLSKRYSLCGARLGALVSLNQEVMAGALRIAQSRLSAGLIDQTIAAEIKKVPFSHFQKIKKEYQKRRDIIYSGLKKIPGVFIPKPEGAFYTIVTLPVDDAEDFCRWLLTDFRLNNETVMLAPANGFYATQGLGKNQVRLAYVINANDLKKSIKIIQKALAVYNKKIQN
ncbi:MAG: pyridoxal phosphate-dependent aminotransferase [Microgenomates group bacterium]|nr:pyridoxal phosphate-dependent aminotransferase [Microgenomates group bacterium]